MNKFLKKYNCIHESWSPLGGKGAKTLTNKTLKSIAEKYGKTPAQIALRFLLQLDIMIIPKTVNKDRMKENFDVFEVIENVIPYTFEKYTNRNNCS